MADARRTLRRLGLVVCAACLLLPAAPVAAATARILPAADRAVNARAYPDLVLRGKITKRIAWNKLPTKVAWDGTKAGNINPTLRAVIAVRHSTDGLRTTAGLTSPCSQ